MSRRGAILQDYGGRFEPQPQDAQRDAAQYYQRDKEQANQMQQQKERDKQKQQGDATDFIGGLNVPHVGDNTIDLYNDAQIQKLQGELNGMQAKGASLQDIKLKAMQELPKISQGYTVAKNGYGQITEGLKDLTKDYPSGDMQTARSLAGRELIKDIFEYDENGNIKGYKDPSLIPQGKNYLESLTTSDKLPQWYRKSGAFQSEIKKLPLIPIKGGTTRTDSRGKRIKQTYTGHGSVFDEPILNDKGEQTGWDLKAESVPLGRNEDGSLIIEKVMPKEQFELAMATPSARADFNIDFNESLNQQGINPDQIDPRAKDVLQRKFAYDFFSNTGIHGSSFLPVDEVKEAPIKNITNITNKSGGSTTNINDVYSGIVAATENRNNDINFSDGNKATRMNSLNIDAQKVIFDYIGDKDLDERNTFLRNNNGNIEVYRVDEETEQPIIDNKHLVATFPKVGTNLKVQSDVKAKKAVVAEGENKRKAKVQSRKGQDGKTYTSTDGITWKASDGTTVVLQK